MADETPEPKGSNQNTFGEAMVRFNASLGSIEDYSLAIEGHLNVEHKDIIQRYSLALIPRSLMELKSTMTQREGTPQERELEKRAEKVLARSKVSVDAKARVISAPKQILSVLQHADQVHKTNHRKQRIARESALIMALSSAEVLVAELARLYLVAHPGKIDDANYKITYSEIAKYSSIDDARDHIIDRRISELTRGNAYDWVTQTAHFYGAGTGFSESTKDRVREIGLRRNLLVHNGGVVNSFYVKNSPEEVRSPVLAGERLSVSSKYLAIALSVLRIVFLMLAAECWRKAAEGNSNDEIAHLLNYFSYDALIKKRWDVAAALSEFVTRGKKLSDTAELIARFNYWQAMKWSGQFEKVESKVKAFDTSTRGVQYRLARYALLDLSDEFFTELRKAVGAGDFDSVQAYEWPIFQEMRNDVRFDEVLKEFSITPEAPIPETSKEVAALLFQRTEPSDEIGKEKRDIEFVQAGTPHQGAGRTKTPGNLSARKSNRKRAATKKVRDSK